MRNKAVLVIILLQSLVIMYIASQISFMLILPKYSVNPTKSTDIKKNIQSKLPLFFEPFPNHIRKTDPSITWTKATQNINDDSLNDRYNYSIEKKIDTYRIITMGDSFTDGLGVNTSEDYPELLEDLLNERKTCKNIRHYEIINLGVSGYDIQYSVERYNIRGKKYNPDMIIWMLRDDDFYEINEMMRKNQIKYELEMKKSGEWDRSIKNGKFYPPTDKLIEDMEAIHKLYGDAYILNKQKVFLNQLNNLFNKKLIYITFPFMEEKYKVILKNEKKERTDTYFFEGLTNIYKEKNLTFLPYDGHPNQKGYQVIAKDIYSYLSKNKLLPCN